MTQQTQQQIPQSFTISFDSWDWNGVHKWEKFFNQIDENKWKETIYKNNELKLVQYVGTDVATRYHNWGYTKTKKTGMDYRNITITINDQF